METSSQSPRAWNDRSRSSCVFCGLGIAMEANEKTAGRSQLRRLDEITSVCRGGNAMGGSHRLHDSARRFAALKGPRYVAA